MFDGQNGDTVLMEQKQKKLEEDLLLLRHRREEILDKEVDQRSVMGTEAEDGD